jgi:hypothetical protein
MNDKDVEVRNRLTNALSGRFGVEEASNLAVLLLRCCCNDSICYDEIDIHPELKDDIILQVYEERLLLPVRSLRGSAWEDRILTFADGERYHMPRVVKLLVERAGETGEWDSAHSLREVLRESGEKDVDGIVGFLAELITIAPRYEVEIDVMQTVRAELGMDIDMHETLDRFVRSGIMSPRTHRSLHTGKAKYEINPCLYWA